MKTRLLLIATIGAFISLAMFSIQPSVRAVVGDGDLDPNFGVGGKTIIDFNGLDDRAFGIAVRPNGKIVTVGGINTGTSNYLDFGVAQINSDGSLDMNFGLGGKVTTDFGGADEAFGVVLQRDGKVIVVGYTSSLPNYGFALARYNIDGSLDTTFGTGGKVTGPTGIGIDVALQTDGKIIAVGFSYSNIVVTRYNSDGSPDPLFGTGGVVITNVAGEATSVALQRDGKILVAGDSQGDIALLRYNDDGSLDATFGTGGIVTTDVFGLGYRDWGYDVALQRDGKFVVAGLANTGIPPNPYGSPYVNSDLALIRYNRDGSLDTSFNSDGIATLDFNGYNDGAVGVELQNDGNVIAVGVASTGPYEDSRDFALARFNRNGILDPSFGIGGKLTTDFFGYQDEAYRGVLQVNGKILIVGSVTNCDPISGCYKDFAVARYDWR